MANHTSVPLTLDRDQEARIISAVLAGQSFRFNDLVAAYQTRLFAAMLAVLGNRQDAEDVTQEAFTKAYLKLVDFQSKSSFFTWLHRIAFHLAIDLRRKDGKSRRMERVGIEVATESLSSNEPSPATRSEQRELQHRVYTALAQLDIERSSVVTLRDLQGLDYSEISEVLQIPIGTVRSRLHRGRLELRDLLSDCWPDQPGSSARNLQRGSTT